MGEAVYSRGTFVTTRRGVIFRHKGTRPGAGLGLFVVICGTLLVLPSGLGHATPTNRPYVAKVLTLSPPYSNSTRLKDGVKAAVNHCGATVATSSKAKVSPASGTISLATNASVTACGGKAGTARFQGDLGFQNLNFTVGTSAYRNIWVNWTINATTGFGALLKGSPPRSVWAWELFELQFSLVDITTGQVQVSKLRILEDKTTFNGTYSAGGLPIGKPFVLKSVSLLATHSYEIQTWFQLVIEARAFNTASPGALAWANISMIAPSNLGTLGGITIQ